MGLLHNVSRSIYSIKVDKKRGPIISLMKKDGDKWIEAESETGYEGFLIGAEISQYTYKEEVKYKLNLILLDEKGSEELLTVNFNSIALNIINTLSNSSKDTIFGNKFTIKLWAKDDDRVGVNIKLQGEDVGWKLDGKEVSEIFHDKEKWIKLFEKHVKPKLEKISEITGTVESTSEDFEDDLPF